MKTWDLLFSFTILVNIKATAYCNDFNNQHKTVCEEITIQLHLHTNEQEQLQKRKKYGE
jgi:hypothetical protein